MCLKMQKFVRERVRRPRYEVNYITKYYNKGKFAEPPRVLGYLQAFVLSNGDVLSGCHPLKPVGHILRYSLANILASEEYSRRSRAMVRRECPGCTSGIQSSLAMKHPVRSAFYELRRRRPSRNEDPIAVSVKPLTADSQ